MIDKRVDERRLADPRNPVQVDYPGPPTPQLIESPQLRCTADEVGSCLLLDN